MSSALLAVPAVRAGAPCPARAERPPPGPTVRVAVARDGRTVVDGDAAGPVHALAGAPRLGALCWTEDAGRLVLEVPRARLEAHLADLLGGPLTDPVRVAAGPGAAPSRGRSLLASIDLARTLDRDGGVAAVARGQLEAFVLTQVLLAVRHTHSDLLEARGPRERPTRLHRVLEHMAVHADQALSPGELARVGCMSVRALHAAFRRQLGTSPMAHLRRIRLDRVHADLLHCTDPQARIGDVALRWGFTHPSRFARQYAERFGELPSDTARRREDGGPRPGTTDQRAPVR